MSRCTFLDTDDYTTCWPMDWIGEEFDTHVRTIGVEATSNITYWGSNHHHNKLSIEQQAKLLAEKLSICKLGRL